MEQFNSTRSKSIYETIILKYRIGLMIDGWLVWLQAEDPNEDFGIALIIWDRLFISVHFKDILEAISLILLLQDNVLIGPGIFPNIYHVGSNFNPHSIVRNGLVLAGQNLSRKQTVFFLSVDPRNESHRDLNILTSLYHVSRDTCKMHGRDIKMRYFGSILILESEKD